MKRLGLLLVCWLLATPVYARRPLDYTLSRPGPHRDLQDHTLYEVRFTCDRGASPSADSNDVWQKFANFFVHHNEAANQYLVISNDPATPDPSDQGKVKLPEKAISITPVFSIKGGGVVQNFGACSKSIYVQATQRIYLIPIVAWSAQYTEGPLLAGLYEATKVISPLWSIFDPAAIPAAIASKITNVQATENTIKNILMGLNKDKSYGETVRLQTGGYVITTNYSMVALQVSKIDSIVTFSDDLRRDFRSALDAAPQKIPATNFEDTCRQIATTLAGAGFSQDEDIPYAVTYLARVPLSTKKDIIHCLGENYAIRAARLGDILWSWIPIPQQVTEDEANAVYPSSLAKPRLQPDFKAIEEKLDDLVRALSRIAKNIMPDGTLPPKYVAELKSDLAATVLINDKTDAAAFNGLPPLDAQMLSQEFIDNGYFRFGCLAQITDKFGNNTDGAAAIFLSFHAAKDAPPPTTLDATLGVRVLFGKDGLITQLTLTDKRTVITAALNANRWSCNGFTVQKPASIAELSLTSRTTSQKVRPVSRSPADSRRGWALLRQAAPRPTGRCARA